MAMYKLVAPGFPRFIPVSPHAKPPGRWLPWGRSQKPGIISIGADDSYLQRRNAAVPAIDYQPDDPWETYPRIVNDLTQENKS
jgi:hypothetical protein